MTSSIEDGYAKAPHTRWREASEEEDRGGKASEGKFGGAMPPDDGGMRWERDGLILLEAVAAGLELGGEEGDVVVVDVLELLRDP